MAWSGRLCLHFSRNVLAVLLIFYVVATIYSTYSVFQRKGEGRDLFLDQHNIRKEESELAHKSWSLEGAMPPQITSKPPSLSTSSPSPNYTVEIWGKAAIGDYLWQHILHGRTDLQADRMTRVGQLTMDNIHFTYRTGYSVTTYSVPRQADNVVLVLNGMSDEKITFAKSWLDAIATGDFINVQTFTLMILGNEQCRNEWFLQYMESYGGPIKYAFVVYDSPLVDDKEIWQWPLGVATYRHFPLYTPAEVDIITPRPYLCNYMATIYKGTSRETLLNIIKEQKLHSSDCYLKDRTEWSPNESQDSISDYIDILSNSDLTLSPVGKNTECYRIYEALSLGSVPVIEDVLTPGECDNVTSNSPLRLLKRYEVPAIFVKSWSELPQVLAKEKRMTIEEKVARRATVVNWYAQFRETFQKQFLSVLKSNMG